MIRTRIITGLIIALVIIGSILLLPFHALTLLISFIVSLSTWEFIRLRFSSEIAVLIALILFFSFIYLSFGITFKFILISLGLLTWVILFFQILAFPHNKSFLQNKYIWLIATFLTHIPFWTSIFLIVSYESNFLEGLGLNISNRSAILLLISISAITDTLAYFGGKKYGKRKFLSNISPKKTLEGFFIALVGTTIIFTFFFALFAELGNLKPIILVFIVSLFSVLGDASASLFKRASGVKDSSNLIPGHGGILDRIDSHLAAAPAFVILVFLMDGS